jgi:predicted transposase/invertase (TIGR01784 family)
MRRADFYLMLLEKRRIVSKKKERECMTILPLDAEILPPCDDRVFKLILTSPEAKPALMDLISSSIGRRVVDVQIRNNELPLGDTEEKAERLDVNCVIDGGEQIDLEMQASRIKEDLSKEHENLKGKSVYYLCDLHSSQSSKGKAYDELVKSYQVTFCAYTVFPKRKTFVNSYSMRHDLDNELLSDAIHVVFVELSKLDEILKKPVAEMTDMEKWGIFFQYAGNPKCRDAVNEVIESKEALTVASSLLMGISQNEKERAIFRSRRMYQTDLESNLRVAERTGRKEGLDEGRKEGLDEGRKEGRKEGLDEGRKEGIEEGQKNVAKNMLSKGLPVEQVAAYTMLPREEVEKLLN